eukprot:EG_transcript_22648
MGSPPSTLNSAYHAWGVSLEGRLRPRFLYLQSLGKVPATLSAMSIFSDEQFAVSLAKTNLQHYHSWRLAHGFPVPVSSRRVSTAHKDVSPLRNNDATATR